MPRWLDREGQRQNRRSAAQERKRAKETGGRTQPGSGSSWRAPQDVVTDGVMESVKYTDKDQFVIRIIDVLSVEADSLRHGRDPRMVVEFSKHGKRIICNIEDLI